MWWFDFDLSAGAWLMTLAAVSATALWSAGALFLCTRRGARVAFLAAPLLYLLGLLIVVLGMVAVDPVPGRLAQGLGLWGRMGPLPAAFMAGSLLLVTRPGLRRWWSRPSSGPSSRGGVSC